jgi:heme/copper-type cytochrome/quinol oxidase subunit 1
MITIITEYGNGIGWTLYPPLSITLTITNTGIITTIYGLELIGISSTLTSINFSNT